MRRVDVLNSEIVSLIQLRLSSEFDPHWVFLNRSLVSHKVRLKISQYFFCSCSSLGMSVVPQYLVEIKIIKYSKA